MFIWFRYPCYTCFITRIRPFFFIFPCSGTTCGTYGLSDDHAWVEFSYKISGLNAYVSVGLWWIYLFYGNGSVFINCISLGNYPFSVGFLLWLSHRNRMDPHPKCSSHVQTDDASCILRRHERVCCSHETFWAE